MQIKVSQWWVCVCGAESIDTISLMITLYFGSILYYSSIESHLFFEYLTHISFGAQRRTAEEVEF